MKGLVPLLEAVAKLRTEREVELVVIGRPRPGGRVDRAIERLGLADTVRCVSGISDDELARLYAEAQVAVVPSLYEGFSLPAIEAMACGVPVVATTGGALPEVVGPRRRDGLLVPPGRPRGAGRRRSGGCSTTPSCAPGSVRPGRERVLGRFTWEVTARGTADVLPLGARGPPAPGAVAGSTPRSARADRRLRPARGPAGATGCSTSGAGSGATPSRPRAVGAGVVALDAGCRRRSAGARPRSAPWSRRASSTPTATPARSRATPLRLPFADGTFDRVIASEVLEHIPDDAAAMAELARVLRPGGTMAVTVPRCGPEVVNWVLSDEYHDVPGGHVRIYRRSDAPRPALGGRPRAARAATTPTACTRPTGGCAASSGPTDEPPGRRRLPPAAGLGHRAGAAGHPDRGPGARAR